LPVANTTLNTSVPIDTVFNGNNTNFVVTKTGGTAVSNTDYVITEGMFTFLTPGTYTIEITNSTIISNPSLPAKVIATCIVSGVGIEDVSVSKTSVYPNPARDNITVVLPENLPYALFTLYDMQGRVLIRQNINSRDVISVNNLASGIYVYEITTENQTHQGRIVRR
jgi:hypothetical protein